MVLIWFKRATGIYYHEFPSLTPHVEQAKEIERKSSHIEQDLDKLSKELAKRGYDTTSH